MRWLVAAISFAILSGCSGGGVKPNGKGLCDPTISEVGPDTFYGEDSCGGKYSLKGAVMFCEDRKQKMILSNKMDDYIIFQCLDADDSEYVRREYRRAPDVQIEDAR